MALALIGAITAFLLLAKIHDREIALLKKKNEHLPYPCLSLF
jgi:hypothetical protein